MLVEIYAIPDLFARMPEDSEHHCPSCVDVKLISCRSMEHEDILWCNSCTKAYKEVKK